MVDGDVEEISDNLKKDLLQLLLVDLASLADELLAEILMAAKKDPGDYRFLIDKALAVACKSKEKWSQQGVLELTLIRNKSGGEMVCYPVI